MLSKLIPVFAGLVLGKEIYFKSLFLLKYLSKSASDFVPLKQITLKFLCLAIKSSGSFGATKAMIEIDKKAEKLQRLMNDEIGSITYKKWRQRYTEERAGHFHGIDQAQQRNNEAKWQKLLQFLVELTGTKDV